MKTRRVRLVYRAATQTTRSEKSKCTIDVHHGLGGHSMIVVISAPMRDTTLRSRSRRNINHSKCSLFIIFSRISRECRAECNLFRKKRKSHHRVERPGIIRHSEMAAARERVEKRILREVRMGLPGRFTRVCNSFGLKCCARRAKLMIYSSGSKFRENYTPEIINHHTNTLRTCWTKSYLFSNRYVFGEGVTTTKNGFILKKWRIPFVD